MAYCRQIDPPWLITFASAGCTELTGYRPEDLTGDHALTLGALICEEDRAGIIEEVRSVLQTGDIFKVTYRIRTASGEEKWVWDRGRKVTGTDGTPLAVEGFISDASSQIQAIHRLQERVADRNRELTTVLEIARKVAATLELEPLLNRILDELQATLDFEGAGIIIRQGDEFVQLAARGPSPERIAEGVRLPASNTGLIHRVMAHGDPLVIPDVWADDPVARDYRRNVGEEWLRLRPYVRSWLGAALQYRGNVLGLMVISHGEPDYFTDHHVRLMAAVAAQASVAIENARLVAALRERAALEERQRLARDLHDAVTQTLFSASLIGDVLPKLWERNPQRGEEALDDLRVLTRGALAEMRTLLFELRPAALTETPLGDLLRHLADATTGRARLPVSMTADGVQTLPPDAQVAFYRIAQEALNNIVKHAGASKVEVELTGTPEGVVQLRVRDDGHGFDPANTPVGHFGMETMRERAEAIGAQFTVTSSTNGGTEVMISWPDERGTDPPRDTTEEN